MREIEFRGKRVDNGDWVYGFYATVNYDECFDGKTNTPTILEPNRVFVPYEGVNGFYEVIPETVGQFTGLHDKNGKEIYEGDIIDNLFQGIHQKLLCEWTDNGFHFRDVKDGIDKYVTFGEVIGNIHENKELLPND